MSAAQFSLFDVLERPLPVPAPPPPAVAHRATVPAVAPEAASANSGAGDKALEPLRPRPAVGSYHRGWTIVPIDPKRLISRFDERQEGDVCRSMSCQSLAEEGRIRAPFRLHGAEYVQTAGSYGPNGDFFECYKVVAVEAFTGPNETYRERDERRWEAARNNPNGGYHGMRARHGSREVVLVGPPIVVVAGQASQGALL